MKSRTEYLSFNIPARVASIEYDPNRTSRIALLVYADGEKRYIIAPLGVHVGDTLVSGPTAPLRDGNALPVTTLVVIDTPSDESATGWRQGCRNGRSKHAASSAWR